MEALRNRGFWFDMICFAAIIVVMVTACVQIRKYAGIAYDFGSNIVRTDAKDKGEDILTIEVVIDDTMDITAVAELLQDSGVIANSQAFAVQARLGGYAGKIIPGTYVLNSGMTTEQILETRLEQNMAGQTDFYEGRPDMERGERLAAFIESMEAAAPPFLRELEKEALAEGIPIIRPRTQGLIRFFITMTRPGRILEVGTATGFSALLMDHWAPAGCRITTMEKMPDRISQARANFRRYGADGRITLLEGDAMELLPRLEGPFDLIFMDAAKGQYIHYLPEIKRLLPVGGLLISDNILQQEELLESRFAVTRRNRTIYKRMREYLRAITGDPDLQTLILELGDGAAVTYRKA